MLKFDIEGLNIKFKRVNYVKKLKICFGVLKFIILELKF